MLVLLLVMAAAGCGTGEPPADESANVDPLPPAPWREASLTASEVPAVYLREWERAENRESCALIAPAGLGEGEGARARAATFSGGWAVAYDLPELRSAFGVAGSGAEAGEPTYDGWPNAREWADGSRAEYGLEGGTGPNHLAYLWIAGRNCLYNIWSRLGIEHLEVLLEQLRFVESDRP